MADKKSRSEKMYAGSPKIGKDENGKPKVTKGEEKSAEVNAGTEGVVKGENPAAKEMLDRHAMERLKLHQAHEAEHLKLAQKYSATGVSGADEIKKIEDKGE